MHFLETLSQLISYAGVAIICFGLVVALWVFVRLELRPHAPDIEPRRAELRRRLGYYLLLGLEVLIAADVIESIAAHDRERLIELGVIVVLRTVLSVSLGRELKEVSAEIQGHAPHAVPTKDEK